MRIADKWSTLFFSFCFINPTSLIVLISSSVPFPYNVSPHPPFIPACRRPGRFRAWLQCYGRPYHCKRQDGASVKQTNRKPAWRFFRQTARLRPVRNTLSHRHLALTRETRCGDRALLTGSAACYQCLRGVGSIATPFMLTCVNPVTPYRHTQGSCSYRRNLTISQSLDGGASWSVQPWGLIYPGRIVSIS